MKQFFVWITANKNPFAGSKTRKVILKYKLKEPKKKTHPTLYKV